MFFESHKVLFFFCYGAGSHIYFHFSVNIHRNGENGFLKSSFEQKKTISFQVSFIALLTSATDSYSGLSHISGCLIARDNNLLRMKVIEFMNSRGLRLEYCVFVLRT